MAAEEAVTARPRDGRRPTRAPPAKGGPASAGARCPRLDGRRLAARKFRGRAEARDRARFPGTRARSGGAPEDAPAAAARGPVLLAQARHCGADPLPHQARHAPVLRANPSSEVTDPACRLPLPTLFYRLEALHLGDLLRIWVRSGADCPRSPPPDFQGPRGRSGHRCNCGALRVPNPISLLEDSRVPERL